MSEPVSVVDISDDDDVFLDEESTRGQNTVPERSRHLSDCIDSLGNISIHEFRRSYSVYSETAGECSTLQYGRMQKDRSLDDLGYYSPERIPSSYVMPMSNSSAICKPLWRRYSCGYEVVRSDDIDAKVNASFYNEPPKASIGIEEKVGIAEARTRKYDELYNMTFARRGKAIVLNNDTFVSSHLPAREGSKVDVIRLKECFELLDFDVEVYDNLSHDAIAKLLKKLADDDHSDSDCFVLTVLTHGMHSNLIWAHDYPFNVDELWTTFLADKCPSLAGKPKIFFIQACRGDQLDKGMNLVHCTQTDSSHSSQYKIPNHADFLIAFSTTEGMYSFRNAIKGTWFIQSLCEQLQIYGRREHFMNIMQRVLRRVALDYESYHEVNPALHGQKQVPIIHSTLLRDVYFTEKLPKS